MGFKKGGNTGTNRKHTNNYRGGKVESVEVKQSDIDAVIDQGRKDPLVFSFAGKMDTCKSGILCELVSRIKDGLICPIMDFDHSIIPIIDKYYPDDRDKFMVINATAFGKEYKRGLVTAMAALDQLVKQRGNEIGLLAVEGMDRLYQRSFKMTCQARGYNMEDLKFFGKGGETDFTPVDWMIRNDYNVDPFDLLYNYASQCGVDLVVTTHTKDEINNKRDIVKEDTPIWYKTIPDYISYLFITKKRQIGKLTKRVAVCEKARINTELYGQEYTVQEFNQETRVAEWKGFYEQLKDEITFKNME